MTASPETRPAGLVLPPAFTGLLVSPALDAHAEACRLAEAGAEAGTLILGGREAVIDVAVVLAPEEPLAGARRALFAGMWALAEAVGGFGPPEIPVTILWPDTLHFNGARLGGGRLGAPEGCGETAVPDWLVFSGALIASKRHAGDPGLTPDSTALDEEGFPPDLRGPLVESFARHLTKAFEVWSEDGFARLAGHVLARLALPPGAQATGIGAEGTLQWIRAEGRTERWPLPPTHAAPSWHDPANGTVRL